ncbi:exonuclease-endonuclease-phosphatase family protein [Metarhizium robertsii]|uniref:Exonuclease-endonuclease-phosphatase family protein n=1 Tax=Metarhizium robertsii TaxID=568076 RepID=A0A014PGA8_9HYPO|nr:exonuclease-endonuclease-phosphatase family protein [Metarhizium robertsii]
MMILSWNTHLGVPTRRLRVGGHLIYGGKCAFRAGMVPEERHSPHIECMPIGRQTYHENRSRGGNIKKDPSHKAAMNAALCLRSFVTHGPWEARMMALLVYRRVVYDTIVGNFYCKSTRLRFELLEALHDERLPEAGQGDIDDAVITYSPVDSWDSNDTRPRVMTYIREDSRILADQKRPALTRDIPWLTVNGATIVNCYRQPHYESPWTSLLRRSAPEMTLVAGDFNAKHYSWQTGRLEGCGEDIATWAAENGLNLLNTADPEPATGAGQIGCQSCRSRRTERNEKCAVVADECPAAAAEYRAIRRILPLGFSQEVQLARRELQRVVRRAKRQYWRILIDGFSDGAAVYKAVRWLKSPGAFQPPPLQIGDDVYETQLDKANVLGHSTLERRTVADNIADPWILVLPAQKIPFAQ